MIGLRFCPIGRRRSLELCAVFSGKWSRVAWRFWSLSIVASVAIGVLRRIPAYNKSGSVKDICRDILETHHGLNLLQSVHNLQVDCALELLASEYVRIEIRTRCSIGRTHLFRA